MRKQKYRQKLFNTNEIDKNTYRASNPEAAAKKIWRSKKYLNVINVEDIVSGEIYQYNCSDWINKSRNKHRKFCSKKKLSRSIATI